MTRKTRLHIIRHGETSTAGTAIYQGHDNAGLSDRGKQMYLQLTKRLAQTGLTACYTSDLYRCLWGARLIGKHIGLEPRVMPCLRELNFGIWDGKAVDEVRQIYPDSWQAWSADFVNYRIPGGENLLDVRLRVLPVIAEMVRQHYDEEVLVVAHGGVNRIILLDAMNAPLSSFYNINQSYCCHNIIDYYEDGNAVVQLLNESL